MDILKSNKRTILLLSAVILANTGLQILVPRFLSAFIDRAETNAPMTAIALIIAGYLFTVAAQKGAGLCEEFISCRLGGKITNRIRHQMLEHFINLPMNKHDTFSSGEIMTRLDEDVEGVYEYYQILFLRIGTSVLLLVGVILSVAMKNRLTAILMLAVSLFSIWIYKVISDFGTKCYLKSSQAAAVFNGILKDKLDNLVEIHLAGAERHALVSLKKAMHEKFRESLPAGQMYGRLWRASTVMEVISVGGTLLIASLLWDKGMISLGTAYLFYNYVDLIYAPLQSFRNHLGGLQNASARKKRVEAFLKEPAEDSIPEEYNGYTAPSAQDVPYPAQGENTSAASLKDFSSLEVRNLHFSYQEGTEILRGISFTIHKGDLIGIMGETGCGKTTLVKLLARLYSCPAGSIFINGLELDSYSLKELREEILYCPQKPQLLHASLRDNITLFDPDIRDEDIYKAINALGLDHWLEGFERGLNTSFSSAEGSISAGEAQFVSIIRLFLRHPQVIILDEITSSLDKKKEKELMNAIKRLSGERTVLMIAHHPEALRMVNKILVLDGGFLVEEGETHRLMNNPGSLYYKALTAGDEKGGISL